ncbi:hypothetical protein LSH36_62g01025, partial [Paralvinella palmiformis]
ITDLYELGLETKRFNNFFMFQGINLDKEYIATQGPPKITIQDFWQMVWQEDANRIVMLANLSENGRVGMILL